MTNIARHINEGALKDREIKISSGMRSRAASRGGREEESDVTLHLDSPSSGLRRLTGHSERATGKKDRTKGGRVREKVKKGKRDWDGSSPRPRKASKRGKRESTAHREKCPMKGEYGGYRRQLSQLQPLNPSQGSEKGGQREKL